MEKLVNSYKGFVLLFSEAIWIYNAIVLFTSIEWDTPVFFLATWMVVAGFVGYTINLILAKIALSSLSIVSNIILLGLIIFFNWKEVVVEGAFVFGLVVTAMISFIYLRSASFVYKQPMRREIVYRFDGNIVFYIIFASIFTARGWGNGSFHFYFIGAIIVSLVGIILSLQHDEQGQEDKSVEIKKVGKSTWFAGFVTFLIMVIPVFSLALLLPPVYKTLYGALMGFWRVVIYIYDLIATFFNWLLGLLNTGQIKGQLPEAKPSQDFVIPTQEEEIFFNIPYLWITGAIVFIVSIIAIWILTKSLKRKNANSIINGKQVFIEKESWWDKIKDRWSVYLSQLNEKWRRQFPFFYHHSVYWYYYQLQRWGKKRGYPILKTETSQEYVQRIVNGITNNEKKVFRYNNENYELSEVLIRLNKDYQATYYGNKKDVNNEVYKLLFQYLKNL